MNLFRPRRSAALIEPTLPLPSLDAAGDGGLTTAEVTAVDRAVLRAELDQVFRPGARPSERGLAVHYQPIVELASGVPRGFEALLRWHHPFHGLIPAQDIVEVAEASGRIVELGDWVLRQALIDASMFGSAGSQVPYVSINVSADQLDPGFTDRTRGQIAAVGLDPSQVVLEITESRLVPDSEGIWDDLVELRRTGVQVAIDDFGTGYSSLAYLRHPVIDMLKLDQTFLGGLGDDRSRTILRSVVELAGNLGIDLVAEGIENDATLSLLVDLGCAFGQGFLFAPAMSLEDALRWESGAAFGQTSF
jgi:EAL domain-containing protein (putative c-di-GMP-specific phosphodiesterase class I)